MENGALHANHQIEWHWFVCLLPMESHSSKMVYQYECTDRVPEPIIIRAHDERGRERKMQIWTRSRYGSNHNQRSEPTPKPPLPARSSSPFLQMSSTSTVISENSVRVNYLNEFRIVSIEAVCRFVALCISFIHICYSNWRNTHLCFSILNDRLRVAVSLQITDERTQTSSVGWGESTLSIRSRRQEL